MEEEYERFCVVTYWVNLLQNLPRGGGFVIKPDEKSTRREEFRKFLGHPVFDEHAITAQEDLKSRLQGENNTWYTTCRLRYGFHEDGIHHGRNV